ncbi:ATP-binding cassette domain-containing protein, partial [Candidatus Berkelbacteria bacterium]|nr:ATP-binding cassette domain-containing protein [Candidatus Berkelbacteria bacterium]
MAAVIEVVNLSKRYPFYRKEPGIAGTLRALVSRRTQFANAVQDVSFSINQGELVGFLGPNGAGKTTTLKMLSGILHPTHGEVRVLDHVPVRREKEYLRQIALVMGQKN